MAAEQVRELLQRMPKGNPVPLFVFDAGYDAARLSRELEGYSAQLLVRLNFRRCFYADPPEVPPEAPPKAPPAAPGRPRLHSRKFVCKDPATWPEPIVEYLCRDVEHGEVRGRAWSGLHPKLQTRPHGEAFDKAPIARGTVVLVEVGRLPRGTRGPRALWLWWVGPGGPGISLLWRAYCRRFDLEHAFRFLEERLGWTSPRVRHPEQDDMWTWLIVAAYSQLRLAR